jgi:putative hydroxymethylpyrimidine transport system substrate-binding protein
MIRFVGAAAALFVAGTASGAPLRVLLDFYPNPNHAPLYVAQARGFFAQAGVEVDLIPPTNPADPVKLTAARAVDLALTPQMNHFLAVGAGLPIIAVGALIDGALGGLLGLEDRGFRALADLRGRRIGYSLEPLEPVLWRTMLATVGLGPDDYELIFVGMNTMAALLTGRVDAIGAFRNWEVLAVEQQGRDPLFFPQEEHGVPDTYELVVVAHSAMVAERLGEVRAFLTGLAAGIAYTRDHPAEAFALFISLFPDLVGDLTRRSFAATLPLYAAGARHDDVERWAAMHAYLVAHGLFPGEYPLTRLFTVEALP